MREWITMFDLVFVALDPFTNESALIIPTAGHILTDYDQADCRVAWLVAGDADDARKLLGTRARDVLTFVDPDRSAIAGFGLTALPAIVHLGSDGTIVNAAEGWHPQEWRTLTEALSRRMSWSRPVVPGPGAPPPFDGTPV